MESAGGLRFSVCLLSRYPYKPKRGAPADIEWPPKGLHLQFHFKAPKSAKQLQDVTVFVNYEIYDGAPIMAKWVEISSRDRYEIRASGEIRWKVTVSA